MPLSRDPYSPELGVYEELGVFEPGKTPLLPSSLVPLERPARGEGLRDKPEPLGPPLTSLLVPPFPTPKPDNSPRAMGLGTTQSTGIGCLEGGHRGLGVTQEVTLLSPHSPLPRISDSGFNPSAAYPEASPCWPRAGGGGRRAKVTLASVLPRLPAPRLAL